MASRRRPLRVLLLLVLALLLWLLLELNRFLPGSWPGGGGDTGSRPMPAGSEPDPKRVRPDETPIAPLVPQAPILRVVLAAPAGAKAAPATITARTADGRTLSFTGSGTVAGTGTGAIQLDGTSGILGMAPDAVDDLVVERAGKRLFHGPFPRATGTDIVVAWPRAPLPSATPRPPGPAPLRVTDEAGAPVAKAEVHVTGRPGKDAVTTTDAEGRAQIVLPPAGRVRICAAADGFGEACIDASMRSSEPLEIRLPRMERRSARLVDPETGAALRATAVRLRGSDGAVRDLPPPEGGFDRVEVTWPRTRMAGASVEIEVPDRPLLRVPLDTLPDALPIPGGRTVEVIVSSPTGPAALRVPVAVRWAPEGVREPLDADTVTARVLTDKDGRARVPVPAGRAVEILVEPEGAAPTGRTISADAKEPVPIALAAGVPLRVRVETADGKPVVGANVVALARAGNATVRRRALTSEDGTATLPPVGEGRLEVYAHRPGFSWAVATVDARPGAGPTRLVLSPGRRLSLVVEDPDGLPLGGVAVRSVARADASAGAPDPMDPDGAPWTTDADGVLVVEDLPDREMDLYLGRAGHEEEVLARVRPGATTWFATLVRTRR